MIWKAGDNYEIVGHPITLVVEGSSGVMPLKFQPGEILTYKGCRTPSPGSPSRRFFSPTTDETTTYYTDNAAIETHLRRL